MADMVAAGPDVSNAQPRVRDLLCHRNCDSVMPRLDISRKYGKCPPSSTSPLSDCMAENNQSPQVFVWTATAESALHKMAECREASNAVR